MPIRTLWVLFLLKQKLNLANFPNTCTESRSESELIRIYGKEEYEKAYPSTPAHFKITYLPNLTIFNVYNLPRRCGKTTILTTAINQLDGQKCAYFNHNYNVSWRVKRNMINNKKCEIFSLSKLLKHGADEHQVKGKSFDHFFFDDFKYSYPITVSPSDAYDKALHYITSCRNPSQPSSIAVFVH